MAKTKKKSEITEVEVIDEAVETTAEVATVSLDNLPEPIRKLHTEFGLAVESIVSISNDFKPLVDTVIAESEKLKGLSAEDPKSIVIAQKVNSAMRKVNGEAERKKKGHKAGILALGRLIDSEFNSVKSKSELVQLEAKTIIDFAEEQERIRIAALQQEREKELVGIYEGDTKILNLGSMSQEIWEVTLQGFKATRDQKLAEAQKAEEDKIKKESREALIAPYIVEYKELFFTTDLLFFDEAQFISALGECKESFEVKEKERQRIADENAKLLKEKEEMQTRVASRLALIPQISVLNGIYITNFAGLTVSNQIQLLSVETLATIEDEVFTGIVTAYNKHKEKYCTAIERRDHFKSVMNYNYDLNEIFTFDLEAFNQACNDARKYEEDQAKISVAKSVATTAASSLGNVESISRVVEGVPMSSGLSGAQLGIKDKMKSWVDAARLKGFTPERYDQFSEKEKVVITRIFALQIDFILKANAEIDSL